MSDAVPNLVGGTVIAKDGFEAPPVAVTGAEGDAERAKRPREAGGASIEEQTAACVPASTDRRVTEPVVLLLC